MLLSQVMASLHSEKLKETEEKLKATIESNKELRVKEPDIYEYMTLYCAFLYSFRWPLKKPRVYNGHYKRKTPVLRVE